MLKAGLWKHYKGNIYELLFVAQHTELEDEQLVIYRSAKDKGQYWARPYKMWLETVEIDGKEVRRFEYIGD